MEIFYLHTDLPKHDYGLNSLPWLETLHKKNQKMMEYTGYEYHQQLHLHLSLFCTKLECNITALFNITTQVELDDVYYFYCISVLE